MTQTSLSKGHKLLLEQALKDAEFSFSYENAYDILDGAVSNVLAESKTSGTPLTIEEVFKSIDNHRGKILKERKQFTKGTDNYTSLSRRLDLLNTLKREFSELLDTDERPLGL